MSDVFIIIDEMSSFNKNKLLGIVYDAFEGYNLVMLRSITGLFCYTIHDILAQNTVY